jgi:hypothetical protein
MLLHNYNEQSDEHVMVKTMINSQHRHEEVDGIMMMLMSTRSAIYSSHVSGI